MTGTDRLGALLAAIFVVSIPAATVVAAPAPEPSVTKAATATPSRYLVAGNLPPAASQAQIEQVGEGDDVETLDEGASPQQTQAPADAEPADNATNQEDVELLDQGAPPATTQPATAPATTAAPAVAPAAAAPASTSALPPAEATTSTAAAPSAPAGPALPPGFGTGQVHVSTGGAAFPSGLADCHVGAVTGRAYVGIDCGDEGAGNDSFVGHAPSFNDFPFVVDPGFPFNRDSGFFVSGGNESNDTGFFASRSGSTRNDGEVISASGTNNPRDSGKRDTVAGGRSNIDTSTVDLTQRAKTRKPRVRVDDSGASSERAGHDKGKKAQSATASVNTENRRGISSNSPVTRAQKSGKQAHKSKKGKDRKAKAEGKKRPKSENKKRQSKSEKKQKRQEGTTNRRR